MDINNGFVRCVGYRRSERYFTIGKVYEVVNGSIRNDNGYTYVGRSWDGRPMVEWLSDWYIFEEVKEYATNVVCSICGEKIANNEYTWVDGDIVCNSCKEEHVYFCDCCGRAVLDENSHYANNQTWCKRCFEQNFRECACCGETVYFYDMIYSTNGYICENCECDHYTRCASCGELIHTDYAYWDEYVEEYFCEDCNERRNRAIKPYSFKPIPFFRGSNNRNALYMGVELEIDGSGEDTEYAQILLDIANADTENIYIKHDGSLEDGFEIVSHPCTLDYHLNAIPWKELSAKAVSLGYRSHNTDTCGLHVHVSRKAFGDNYDEQEEAISKILYFIENNWDNVLRFTRRTERNMDEWASRYGICNDIKSTYEKAKGEWNRYRCLNLCNDNTIEFRMFRGTLNHTTFCATLELVHNICNVCHNASVEDIANMDWSKFLSHIDMEKYTELNTYLNIRGLNV